MNKVEEKVKAVLANHFEILAESIDLTHNIIDDLGADSLDIVEIGMQLEDEFDCNIPDEAFDKIKTVNDIVRQVLK